MPHRDHVEIADVFPSIKVVAFDAVGTLIYAEPSVTAAYCRIIEETCGLRIEPERVRQVLKARLGQRTDGDQLKTSEETERRFWFELVSEVIDDPKLIQLAFDQIFEHFSLPKHWQCFADVAETLSFLKNRGLRLLLASNFDQRLYRIQSGLHELQPIDSVVVSSEVGWRKPSPNFFEFICVTEQCKPNEVLFIGDDQRADIEGSLDFGMHSVWINRRPQSDANVETNPKTFVIQRLNQLCVTPRAGSAPIAI
jgi:putative hydrolase of the HAD superfamily